VLQTYRTDVERFLTFVQKPLREVTFGDLRAFLDYLALTGVRPGAREATSRRLEGLLWTFRGQASEYQCPFDTAELWRASVPARSLQLYICSECEATWTDPATIAVETWASLASIREQLGLEDDDFEVLR
jgi:hypothetical protein